jgi:thiol-disulfide isomerase/thioredoxin
MKHLFIISLVLISNVCYSEGIKFEHKSWDKILQLAKEKNKPIFVDVYASWCAPCKKMSNEVFTKDSVGKAYNSNFICCHINADSTDGSIIKDQYNIKFFPTFLFVRFDGTLFYKRVGALESNSFIDMSACALTDYNDHKTVQEWDAEYERKKDDTDFLLLYINKRAKLGLPYMKVFEHYLSLIPQDVQISNEIAKIYSLDMDMIYVGSFAYDFLLNNRLKFNETWKYRIESLLLFYFNQTVLKAKKENDLALFEKTMTYFDRIPFDGISITKQDVYKFFHE